MKPHWLLQFFFFWGEVDQSIVPWIFYLALLGVTFTFSQASETSPSHHDLSKIMESGISVGQPGQLSQHFWVHPIRSQGLLYVRFV